MISPVALAALFAFALALVVVWRLMAARPEPRHTPVFVGVLLGVAIGIICWQVIQEPATPPPNPPPPAPNPPPPANDGAAKLVEAERQAREADVKGLGIRLDAATNDAKLVKEDVGRLTEARLDERIKMLETGVGKLVDAKLDERVKALETGKPPPRVTLSAVQVRTVPTGGKLGVFPAIDPRNTVKTADISFCPPQPASGGCTPADKNKKPCDATNFICNGSGTYVTIPSSFAGGGVQFCVQLSFVLQDQTKGVVTGGPLQAHDGATWQRGAAATGPCDQVSAKQETARQ